MALHHTIAWGLFLAIVLILLGIDLFVLHRKPHEIKLKEAFIGAAIPVVAASLFAVALAYGYQRHFLDLGVLEPGIAGTKHEEFYPQNGGQALLLFSTGYLVELSLSADNVFLFVILMTFFKVPSIYQHRVLFWGVIGALVMRGIMIIGGGALLSRFEWIIYIFGAFLVFTGIKMCFSGEPKDPSSTLAVRMARRVFPIHDGFDGKNFFTTIDGKRYATTLFLVLVCIEFTDLVFALDSIPAIFGITLDPYIVFTSNVFAILGLRSMYFLLAGVMDKFHLLKYGLAIVLTFVGVKMLLPMLGVAYGKLTGSEHHWELHNHAVSLGVIAGVLTLSIVGSLIFPSKKHHGNPLAGDAEGSAHAPKNLSSATPKS